MFNAGCGLACHPVKFEKPFDISKIEVQKVATLKYDLRFFS
jgi:hypothetical protein